jgi:hypothetical protein
MANELLEVENSYYVLGWVAKEKEYYKSLPRKWSAIHYFYN